MGVITVTFTGKNHLTIEIDTSGLNATTFVFSPDLKECLDTYWPLPRPLPALLPSATKAVPKKYAKSFLRRSDFAAASAIAEKLRVPPKDYEDPYRVVHCVEGVSFTRGGYVTSGQDLLVPPLVLPGINGCVYMDDFKEQMDISTVLVALEKIKPPKGHTPMAIVAQRNCRIQEWLEQIHSFHPTWETRAVRDVKSLARLMRNLATTDLVVFHIKMFEDPLPESSRRFLYETIWHTVVFAEADQMTAVEGIRIKDEMCWLDETKIFAITPSARKYLIMYNTGNGCISTTPLSDLDTMLLLLGTFTCGNNFPTPVSDRRRAHSILLTNYIVRTGCT
jgi:hypothetical protein